MKEIAEIFIKGLTLDLKHIFSNHAGIRRNFI